MIAGVAHVMQSVYRVERDSLLTEVRGLLTRRNVRVIDMELAVLPEALQFCRGSNRVSVTDALIWTAASMRGLPLATFDRRFPRGTVDVYEPA